MVVDFNDYLRLLEFLKGNVVNEDQFRKELAWKAFQHVASYDSAVAEWLWKQSGGVVHTLLLRIFSPTSLLYLCVVCLLALL